MLQHLYRALMGLPGAGLELANWFWFQRPFSGFRDSGILGMGWGRVSLGKTWGPGQTLPGEGGVMSPPQGLGFEFPCGGSFLSYHQFRKCTVEIRDVVPFYPSLLPILSHFLPAREVFH